MSAETTGPERPDVFRGFVRRHPLVCFFVLAYAIAWLIEIPMDLSASGVLPLALSKRDLAFGIILATFAPTAAAFIMTALVDGRNGVVRLLRRYVQWRAGIQWYLFVLVGIPIIILLGTIVVPGAIASFQPEIAPFVVGYPLAFATTFFLGGPFGEEPGWRGFALPRMQRKSGPLLGAVFLGLLWSFWHFPLFFSGVWTPPTLANMIMFVGMTTALTIIMVWVFNHVGGSLLIMMLMHASFNTFANRVSGLFPAPIFNDYGLLPVLIGFGGTAIVLVVITRGQLGYESKAARRFAEANVLTGESAA